MPKVFLSYARSDGSIVDKIAQDLKRNEIGVWDSQDLRPGQSWQPQIEKAINTADFMLLFLSPAILESKTVWHEYEAALARQAEVGGSRLIPVLLEQVEEVPAFLATLQYVDFTRSYDNGLQALLQILRAPSGPPLEELVKAPEFAEQVAKEVAKSLGIESRASSTRQAVDARLVFVITSFSDDIEPIFEGISQACQAVDLTARRVSDVPGDYRMTDRIIQVIRDAQFIVADLTHERPNVYFELGYARGLGKTVITIAKKGSNIHFDVKDWTYIPYIDSRILERDLKKRLEFELSNVKA